MSLQGRIAFAGLLLLSLLAVEAAAGWWWLAYGTALVALLAAVLAAGSLSRELRAFREWARAVKAGNLRRRPALAGTPELVDAAQALRSLLDSLAARLEALENEAARLRALTESLGEGTVVVDNRSTVVHANDRARALLGLPNDAPFASDHLPRDRRFREAMSSALAGQSAEAVEVTIGERILAMTARPLPGGAAAIALYDVTPLRRLEAVRRDFVANVSHELKTPLTVIKGFAETLAHEELPDEQRTRFAKAILVNAERMQRVIEDLLDLSRIESGGWRPVPRWLPLAPLLEEIAAGREKEALARGLALVAECVPADLLVRADPTALRQILVNLVDNAFRYTVAGEVAIFARARDGGVSVGVHDTGIGIEPEHLPRIFERFYRTDEARARHQEGTGLGLAIVKHLVEAHGGHVSARSQLGVGTTVEAWFPTARSGTPLAEEGNEYQDSAAEK
ncbi:MAG TPA: ATP-binding protein [Gemmatimonadaceae bacterium]|nr:ATP-binding protein [Gemmatimonadaceae bacterium]